MIVAALPVLNATLNATAAVLLGSGWVLIRRGRVAAHRACMLSAVAVSTAFLISYVVYHSMAGSRPFAGQGWIRAVYFPLLISHIVLSITVLPLALTSFYLAFTRSFARHRRLNRVFLPIWLYVSVTGVLIFFLLRGA